jgi:hypothetical protein
MKVKTLAITTLALLAGLVSVSTSSPLSPAPNRARTTPGYQLAQNDHDEMPRDRERQDHKNKRHDRDNQWYQGERGRWEKDQDRWHWRGAPPGDQWYQGQPGHWYQEQNGWQFGTLGVVCNNAGRNCRQGGYLPPSGEGMVSRKNPSLFWHCDSDGHNCNWARRPRY